MPTRYPISHILIMPIRMSMGSRTEDGSDIEKTKTQKKASWLGLVEIGVWPTNDDGDDGT